MNQPTPHPSWIEIDLCQFHHNLTALRAYLGTCQLCLPVKANGYGHGLLSIAQTAAEAKVDFLGVSSLQEGLTLRKAGLQLPILLFGGVHEEQIPQCIEANLDISVSSPLKATFIAHACKLLRKTCRVHLKIDTGMCRIGVRPESALHLYQLILTQPSLQLIGIYSHLATSDTPNHPFAQQQIAEMQRLRTLIGPNYLWHLANSGGVAFYPESYFNMVRPGLLAYGQFPSQSIAPSIRPCLSLKTKVSYFKVVPPNTGIGYGHTYRTQQQSRIATLSIGYGDGYLRALSNRGEVLIRGKRYPIVGNICMDQCMVDLGQGEAYVGDEAVLVGHQGAECISLAEVAHHAQSIPHEILTLWNERIPRREKPLVFPS